MATNKRIPLPSQSRGRPASSMPFSLGVDATAAGHDLRRVGLPSGSPAAQAARDAQSGNPVNTALNNPALQVYPWWERPPLGSLNYNALTPGTTVSLAGGAGVEVVVATKTCPLGYYWCVRGVNIFVQNPTASFNVKYVLRANGTALGDPYSTFGRVANSLEVPFSILEQGSGTTKLELVAVNVDANGPWNVGGSFTGWFTPAVLADKTGGLGA